MMRIYKFEISPIGLGYESFVKEYTFPDEYRDVEGLMMNIIKLGVYDETSKIFYPPYSIHHIQLLEDYLI